MPDLLRIVTRSAGGRPIPVLDLNDSVGYKRITTDPFQFTPAPPTVQWSKRSRRFGGSRAVGETHDNGSVGWTAYVLGNSTQQCAARAETLLQQIEETARGRYLEWAPTGLNPSYLEIAGPGTWTLQAYDPVEFARTQALKIAVQFPVLPLVQWAPMAIGDPFDVDSVADYTFDQLTSASVIVVGGIGGKLTPNGSLTSERGMRHTARGYTTLEGQAVATFLPVAAASYKGGVRLRAIDANNYVDVYVDDNGTNSRLRIDVVIAGVRTNRSSTNTVTRIATGGVLFTVAGRIEGNVVFASYQNSTVGPYVEPTDTTASYTLVAGDAPLNTTAGYSGISWIPQNSGAYIDQFDFRPVWRNLTLPRTLTPTDSIPGSAPALTDVTLATSGGAAAPVFALMGWTRKTQSLGIGGSMPYGVFIGAGSPGTGITRAADSSANLSSTADATALSGTKLTDAAVSGAEAYSVFWTVDPTQLAPDLFQENIAVEVWMRALFATTIVAPTVVVSASSTLANYGPTLYTNEWGATGRAVVASGFWQFYRLGTINMPNVQTQRQPWSLSINVATGAGSTGAWSFDYALLAGARARAVSPTGKPNDSTYPVFARTTSTSVKTISSDLSASVGQTSPAVQDHGLGGSLIEPTPGPTIWLLKLSSLPPDTPVAPAASEQLTHTAAAFFDHVPRSLMLRNA